MRTHVPLSTALYNRLALRHHPLETARCLGNLEGWRAEGGVGVDGGRRSKMNFWSVDAGESKASDIVCDNIINMKHKLKKFHKKVVLWNQKVAEISSIQSLNFQIWTRRINSWKNKFSRKMRRNSKVILFMAIFWAGGLVYLVKNGDKSPNKQVRPILRYFTIRYTASLLAYCCVSVFT